MHKSKWVVGSAVWRGNENTPQQAISDEDQLWIGFSEAEMEADEEFKRAHSHLKMFKHISGVEVTIIEQGMMDTAAVVYNDLTRREFNVSAAARNIETGEIIDPFNGRFVAEGRAPLDIVTNRAFIDDPIRILRAIRKCLQYKVGPSDRLLTLSIDAVDSIGKQLPERILKELITLQKVISAATPEDKDKVRHWVTTLVDHQESHSVISLIEVMLFGPTLSTNSELNMGAQAEMAGFNAHQAKTLTRLMRVAHNLRQRIYHIKNNVVPKHLGLSGLLYSQTWNDIFDIAIQLVRTKSSYPECDWNSLLSAIQPAEFKTDYLIPLFDAVDIIMSTDYSVVLEGVDIKYISDTVRQHKRNVLLKEYAKCYQSTT